MLVLARQKGEKVIINDDIVITVVEIDGGKVRIGFEADPDVFIVHREEVYNAIQRKKQQSIEKQQQFAKEELTDEQVQKATEDQTS